MALTILNNLSAMSAENSLSTTQSNLQNTLTQLSTGLRINSGADDAAGLSIANGMQGNIAALTQSAQNATNGVGMLQTADGALSQVTSLLNRAVTLATEAANGGLTTGANSQENALDTEFQSIVSEINQIGQTTDFNGVNVFTANTATSSATGLTGTTALTTGKTYSIADSATGSTFSYTAAAGDTVATLETKVGTAASWSGGSVPTGVSATLNANGQFVVSSSSAGDALTVSTTDTAVLGTIQSSNRSITFISDGTESGASNTEIQTNINPVSAAALSLSGLDLQNSTNASTALTAINNATNAISAERGQIGASVNRLTAASNVMTAQVQNLTSASNGIMDADVGKTVTKMTQYNILQSTGMAALQQANQAQQAVLKLLQ